MVIKVIVIEIKKKEKKVVIVIVKKKILILNENLVEKKILKVKNIEFISVRQNLLTQHPSV